MKLPRNLSGGELIVLLRRYGYGITHQTGSHVRLTSKLQGRSHHITIPHHRQLKAGTLHSIISEVASYVEKSKQTVQKELFD